MTVLPGTWGVSHSRGFLGDAIHVVEEHNSKSDRFPDGDIEAAWAGHVFVAVGDNLLIEAEWPKVKLSPINAHADAIWATGQPLTGEQRAAGLSAIMPLVGTWYNALAYGYFLAKLVEVQTDSRFDELEAAAAKVGPICSGIMVREMLAMSVDIGPLRTAAIKSPDFVSPADCLRWGLDNGWMDQAVPYGR